MDSKNKFFDNAKRLFDDAEFTLAEEFCNVAEERLEQKGLTLDYERLYCILIACTETLSEGESRCDYSLWKQCVVSKIPGELLVSSQISSRLSATEFETIVRDHFLFSDDVDEILGLCADIVNKNSSGEPSKLYAQFYLTLFICNFGKFQFLTNLRNRYLFDSEKSFDKSDEDNKLFFAKCLVLEKSIRDTIPSWLPRECDSPECIHPFQWDETDLSIITETEFLNELAMLVIDIFPEVSKDEFEESRATHQRSFDFFLKWQEMDKNWSGIKSVTIKGKSSGQLIEFTDPVMLAILNDSVDKQLSYVYGLHSKSKERFKSNFLSWKAQLSVRLFRRVALLMIKYGLCLFDGKGIALDVVRNNKGREEIVHAVFNHHYAAMISELIFCIKKCRPVLHSEFDSIDTKQRAGIVEYALSFKKGDWRRDEISYNDLYRLPYSLETYARINNWY